MAKKSAQKQSDLGDLVWVRHSRASESLAFLVNGAELQPGKTLIEWKDWGYREYVAEDAVKEHIMEETEGQNRRRRRRSRSAKKSNAVVETNGDGEESKAKKVDAATKSSKRSSSKKSRLSPKKVLSSKQSQFPKNVEEVVVANDEATVLSAITDEGDFPRSPSKYAFKGKKRATYKSRRRKASVDIISTKQTSLEKQATNRRKKPRLFPSASKRRAADPDSFSNRDKRRRVSLEKDDIAQNDEENIDDPFAFDGASPCPRRVSVLSLGRTTNSKYAGVDRQRATTLDPKSSERPMGAAEATVATKLPSKQFRSDKPAASRTEENHQESSERAFDAISEKQNETFPVGSLHNQPIAVGETKQPVSTNASPRRKNEGKDDRSRTLNATKIDTISDRHNEKSPAGSILTQPIAASETKKLVSTEVSSRKIIAGKDDLSCSLNATKNTTEQHQKEGTKVADAAKIVESSPLDEVVCERLGPLEGQSPKGPAHDPKVSERSLEASQDQKSPERSSEGKIEPPRDERSRAAVDFVKNKGDGSSRVMAMKDGRAPCNRSPASRKTTIDPMDSSSFCLKEDQGTQDESIRSKDGTTSGLASGRSSQPKNRATTYHDKERKSATDMQPSKHRPVSRDSGKDEGKPASSSHDLGSQQCETAHVRDMPSNQNPKSVELGSSTLELESAAKVSQGVPTVPLLQPIQKKLFQEAIIAPNETFGPQFGHKKEEQLLEELSKPQWSKKQLEDSCRPVDRPFSPHEQVNGSMSSLLERQLPALQEHETASAADCVYAIANSILTAADPGTLRAKDVIEAIEGRLNVSLSAMARRKLRQYIDDLQSRENTIKCLARAKKNGNTSSDSLPPNRGNAIDSNETLPECRQQHLELFLEQGIGAALSLLQSNFHNERITKITVHADATSTTLPAQSASLFGTIATLQNVEELAVAYTGRTLEVSHLMKIFSMGTSLRKLELIDVTLSGGSGDFHALCDTKRNFDRFEELHLTGCVASEMAGSNYFETWLLELMAHAPLRKVWLDDLSGLPADFVENLCRRARSIELGLRCMPVPSDILGFSNVTKLHLVDCSGIKEAILTKRPTRTMKELFLWGALPQNIAGDFLKNLPKNSGLERLTLTMSGGADLHDIHLDDLLRRNRTLLHFDLVVFGATKSVESGASLVFQALEKNETIESLRIFGKDSDQTRWASIRASYAKMLRKNRTIQRIHLLGMEWNASKQVPVLNVGGFTHDY